MTQDITKDIAGIELHGQAREDALGAFYAQMRKWGMAAPDSPPYVLDFGLGAFDRTGLIECWIANEIEGGYCGKMLFVFDGQTCPMHYHEHKLETFHVLQGKVGMIHEGRELILRQGDILRMDVRSRHSFTGIGPALLLEVSKPCIVSDNFFDDTRIPVGGNYRNRP